MRTVCIIMGCTRYTDHFDHRTEWICGEHWRLIPPRRRRAWSRMKRRNRDMRSSSGARIWAHLKRTAFERSVGL